jgi:NADP-dependent 3-hydroxy acid dehydrogenase YdfG
MSTATISSRIQREPELFGQTIVVIGGSAGIGFETARRARSEGAKVILTGRNAERLQHAASEVDALSGAACDAADPVALERFFRDVPTIDHVMVTAGRPYYGRLADMDFAKIRDLRHRRGIRGHAFVRGTAGRSARKTSQPASHHASHWTRGRTGGRGRARRTH